MTENGDVVGWGRNDHGQVGTSEGEEEEGGEGGETRGKDKMTLPRLISLPDQLKREGGVKEIRVGAEHNVALSFHGRVWSWGWNEHGQLGLGDTDDRFQPSLVMSVPRVEQDSSHLLVSGYGFSLLLIALDHSHPLIDTNPSSFSSNK